MIFDQTIDRAITKNLVEKQVKDKSERTPSGKLSASKLGWPLQWQILKAIGVPEKTPDEYVLRKFLRGQQVEEWFLTQIPNVVDKQKLVEYKGCIGYIDALVDHKSVWEFRHLTLIPHEIKSVANSKYKRIVTQREPDPSHKLQACMYALGLGADHFAIDYISTDDYRVECYVFKTSEAKDDVDEIINTYNTQLNKREVPKFEARYAWQANPDYCNYPDWVNLSESQIVDKLQNEFPDSYSKLKDI